MDEKRPTEANSDHYTAQNSALPPAEVVSYDIKITFDYFVTEFRLKSTAATTKATAPLKSSGINNLEPNSDLRPLGAQMITLH